MKKLKKILVVLTVVLMTVCTASINVFADETEEPVVTPADTQRHDGEFEIVQNEDVRGIKDLDKEEIDVDVELNHDDLDDLDGKIEDVEIYTVGEQEQDIAAPNHGKKDTDSSNPVDILIDVTCELDEEVKAVVAKFVDEHRHSADETILTLKYVKNADGNFDDGVDGTWLIETPEIKYNLVKKDGKWYLKGTEGDYDEIKIDVITGELGINWIIQDGNGLKLEEDEFDLFIDRKGNSTEAIIFDGDDVKNFTESWTNFFGTFNVYDFAYNEGAEGLTFKNIQYVVTTLNGEDVTDDKDVKVEYDPVTGEVKVSALKEGEYYVYLQGYYTEKLYEDRPEVNYVDEIAGNLVNYKDDADENAKVEYKVPNWSKNWADRNGDVYSFTYNMTTNEAWATFARVQVNVEFKPNVEVVTASTADGLVNLLVDEETETRGHGRRETVVADGRTQRKINKNAIRQGETVVGYFDIDATKQGVDEEGNILPTVEEVHELTEGVQVTVRIDAKFVKTEDGKLTDFNVYSRHNGETYSYDVDGVEPIYNHRGRVIGYNVTFTADKFSTFAIAYHNYTPYYPPTEYKVLNTGVRA